MLHLHVGPEMEHTVYEAELVGILLGMHLVGLEKYGSTSFVMGMDNQAVIKAFLSTLRNLGHHLAREILWMANQIQKRRQKGDSKLTIQWTARHEGIAGNKQVDHKAKRATEGLISEKKTLLPYLRKPLLINPAAVKCAHHKSLMKKWKRSCQRAESDVT